MSSLYEFWINNPRIWFSANKEDNEYLAQNFYKWTIKYSINNSTKEHLLSNVILYDQVTRNIKKQSQEYDEIALKYAKMINPDDLSAIEWCFCMLPFRHTKNQEIIFDVIKSTWNRIQSSDRERDYSSIEIYRKFLKASYERCPHDKTVVIEKIKRFSDSWNSQKFINILEFAPYSNCNLSYTYSDKITKEFINIITNSEPKPKNIIISLSGGVDSMVSSVILKRLQSKYEYNLIAVHINYTNRETCSDEEIMLKYWCSYLNIPLCIRKIHEINRPLCMRYEMRNIYESYTREVRFNTYRCVAAQLAEKPAQLAEKPAQLAEKPESTDNSKIPFVVLGHNNDDVHENILTNIAQQSKFELLTGMEKISMNESINFIRPMLNIKKDDIYDFSHKEFIPYLPNSTPSWSMRGKIRDLVRPAIIKWHPNMLKGLETLSTVMKDLHELLQLQIDKSVSDTKKESEKYYIWNVATNLFPSKHIFWLGYISTLTGRKISLKSSQFLQEKIEKYKTINKPEKSGFKMPLSKNIWIKIRSELDIVVTEIIL